MKKYWPATAIRLISLIRLTIRLNLRLIGLIRLITRLSMLKRISSIRPKAYMAMLGVHKMLLSKQSRF